MLALIIVSKNTQCEYKYPNWFALDLADCSMDQLLRDNSVAPSQIRKKEIPNKDY